MAGKKLGCMRSTFYAHDGLYLSRVLIAQEGAWVDGGCAQRKDR